MLEKAEYIQENFIEKKAGFISRSLVKKSANEFSDILVWQKKEQAQIASEQAMQSEICAKYFSIMDMENAHTLGFEHLEVIKTWNKV